MRAGRYSIIIGLLVLIAGLVKGSRQHAFSTPEASFLDSSTPCVVVHAVRHHLVQGESSDQAPHRQKRHGKSLVSQAIVADCPLAIVPAFTYYHRHYSLFLPGGCVRQFIGNFSLRGPPAC
ncbi:MAG TPA: hypothetical protein VGM31_22980 [Puia sp.]